MSEIMSEEYAGWLDHEWNAVLDQSQPIVRCRDCKHLDDSEYERWDNTLAEAYGEPPLFCDLLSVHEWRMDGDRRVSETRGLEVSPDDYCSWGERRGKHEFEQSRKDELYTLLVNAYTPSMGSKGIVARTYRCLHRIGIYTANDLATRCEICGLEGCTVKNTKEAFMRIRDMGEKCATLAYEAQRLAEEHGDKSPNT